MSAEFWMNSQLSVARFTGGITINGQRYVVMGTDLLLADWVPVYTKLGRARTLGLITNGTSLNDVKKMLKAKDENQLKLDL